MFIEIFSEISSLSFLLASLFACPAYKRRLTFRDMNKIISNWSLLYLKGNVRPKQAKKITGYPFNGLWEFPKIIWPCSIFRTAFSRLLYNSVEIKLKLKNSKLMATQIDFIPWQNNTFPCRSRFYIHLLVHFNIPGL